MEFATSVATLTFGDAAENHVGMEMLGARGAAGTGFTVAELAAIAARMPRAELVPLVCPAAGGAGAGAGAGPVDEDAAVLVIRGYLSEEEHEALFEEQAALEHDKKAFMYGRVVNKKARWNLCFDTVAHEPDYAAGKGRVVALSDVPLLDSTVADWPAEFGPKASGLKGEGNYYYDLAKCGIGWHGDSERRKVIALRLGASDMPIHFQWYHRGAAVGPVTSIPLRGGDLYVIGRAPPNGPCAMRRARTRAFSHFAPVSVQAASHNNKALTSHPIENLYTTYTPYT